MGVSSDGDPRLLSAMVYESSIPNGSGIKVTQDIVHLCTKARNRLLKPNINLPMGKMKVSIDHLRQLVKHVQKSVHALTYSDVFPIDRMNYTSFEKIVHDRVINALRERVPNSDATIQYLNTFRDIGNSFLLFDLNPLDRVFLIYRGLYFLRFWRQYIKNSRSYTVNENFITYNTYTCVEINANSLVLLIKLFRDRNTPEMFLPSILDSQTCERMFRLLRSMGTTQYTKINFDILELTHKIGRVEVQNDIAYCKLDIDGINIPNKRTNKTIIYPLPTDEQISNKITQAKQDAFQKAQFFGLINQSSDFNRVDDYRFVSKLKLDDPNEVGCDDEFEDDDYDDIDANEVDVNDDWEYQETDALNSDLDMVLDTELEENSPVTYVFDERGERKKVLKSFFVWSCIKSNVGMSNDRIRRFFYKKRKANDT